ncbi:MAG TPA: Gmad2 immunoglobulin-like domain-containing protein [Candidatus Limnocylindrales bacterium]|nr:Gmad2 immunoglobulin-like domain-containing protein [Candidatus Limnocylindrales bacterium]
MGDRALRHAASFPALLVAVALCAVLAGCNTVEQSPPPTSGATGAPGTPTASQPAVATALRAYFGLGSTGGNPVLAPVERPASAAADVKGRAADALAALVAGPNDKELAASPAMFTAIASGTTMKGVQIDGGGIATVDLSTEFQETDELPSLRTALAQVVFTLTQFPEVKGVQVTIGGAVLSQTDAGGQDLGRPATRADYEDQMGPLFVDSPAWGATVQSPIHLSGLADVFEATFRFRLLDADGRSLADGQLHASCGTGCLGDFAVVVPFNVSASTAGRLQVFDLSEADGSMADVVDYPVTLQP